MKNLIIYLIICIFLTGNTYSDNKQRCADLNDKPKEYDKSKKKKR